MPCYNPLVGFRSSVTNPNGKRSIVFNAMESDTPDCPINLPCGRCIGCRLERSRQWAVRCMHEASLHDHNCFITLTYDDEHLPERGDLCLVDFQKFMKRLRSRLADETPGIVSSSGKLLYYMCGEYGDQFARPHYHACLFNLDFTDLRYLKTVNEFEYFTSETLSRIWGKGHCVVGRVTFESAAYVARYCTKKVYGKDAEEHYEYLDEYGEYRQRVPEFTTMSRRPAVAREWINKFVGDVYPSDECVVRGISQRPPKYYDRMFEISCPSTMEALKDKRSRNGKLRSSDNTRERLAVKEKVALAQFSQLKRGYDNA